MVLIGLDWATVRAIHSRSSIASWRLQRSQLPVGVGKELIEIRTLTEGAGSNHAHTLLAVSRLAQHLADSHFFCSSSLPETFRLTTQPETVIGGPCGTKKATGKKKKKEKPAAVMIHDSSGWPPCLGPCHSPAAWLWTINAKSAS